MSITADKRLIICDGEACGAAVAIPVGLRAVLDAAAGSAAADVAGWLFVKTRGGWQHFCPRCAHQYIGRLYGLTSGRTIPDAGRRQPDADGSTDGERG